MYVTISSHVHLLYGVGHHLHARLYEFQGAVNICLKNASPCRRRQESAAYGLWYSSPAEIIWQNLLGRTR